MFLQSGGPERSEGFFTDLRSFMSVCDLYDLKHSGNFLSWRGKRHSHVVRCRLDRSMVNSDWVMAYPSGRSEYLWFEGSDYRPLVTSFDPIKKHHKSLFRYDRRFKDNPEVCNIILKAWNLQPGAPVDHRLHLCRLAIIQWSKTQMLNSKKEILSLSEQLEEAMCDDEASQSTIDGLNQSLLSAYKREEEYWKQRSRQLWLTLRDKNTGYFHAATKNRRAINNISVIESSLGAKMYEEKEITEVISNYFQDIFTSHEGDRQSAIQEALTPCVTPEMNEALIDIPSATEIKQACFNIHADKAPDPDGFSASFFQSNWNNIGDMVIAEVHSFFISGSLPQKINHTHIRLIPKIPTAQKVSDYRPIALCSVYYKIIAKLLAKRLQPVLHTCISENQSAFVPQRAISNNVLITHEVLHYLKTSGAVKRCFMAVKTDMSKAYDRLEWDFIKVALDQMGFHQTWIKWIMQCVSTVSYSFLINDQAKGLVLPQRGIRQGDPLSPYLFIICSEVLSRLCLKAQSNGQLVGARVAKGSPRVNHLLFADDTMFFIRADPASCHTLKRILHKYEVASCQKINQAKSSITFSSKTPRDMKEQAKHILDIHKEGGQGKYLGLPELFGRKKKDLFASIVDRIKQKAISWSSRFLLTAGKLTMLKSVLSVMPTYTMSCFLLPGSLCKRIQSALTRFWWDTSSEKKKMSWIAWTKITKPVKHGGLGIRDVTHFNKALLAKLSWRLLTKPHTLFSKVLLGKYCQNASFLECKAPSSASHGWQSICKGRDLLKENLGMIVGSGASIPLWRTPWLSVSTPLSPMGPPTEASQNLMVADLLLRNSGLWNVELIRSILPIYERDILILKPSATEVVDFWAWLPSKDGSYSSKSGYHESSKQDEVNVAEASSDSNIEASFPWQKSIWSLKTSPKTKLLLWKAAQNALPVGENLLHRSISDSAKCPHCDEPESTLHMFFQCEFARRLWSLLPVKTVFQLDSITSVRERIVRANNLVCLPPTGIGSGPIAPWTAQLSCPKPDPPPKVGIQPPHPRTNLTCYTDTSWIDGKAGLGWIIKDQSDQLKGEGSTQIDHVGSPLMAEALATLTAVGVAIESNITHISFASDSLLLVQALNQKLQLKELHGTLHDVLTLSSRFEFCSFNFIPRSKNRQADLLAKEALLLCKNT
ncbi:PREDICTED: uncharacterized protein LOC104753583 [Camelina sativa]|uniref:Uncharacterized protein LOC104753583 n=1 Tax=Camelina sativa TaxID=90675 RepID=A0ABM0WPD5_CAMSA|nr:PREDICTED: uncharacterized protein LOC104753583 [Camelina sativa]